MPLSPAASTPAKLTVNILDVNDNTPQFKPFGITYYTERILEGATPGTTLIAVAAVDPDKGLNGLITYTLLNLMPPGYVQLEDSSAGRWEGLPEEGWGASLSLRMEAPFSICWKPGIVPHPLYHSSSTISITQGTSRPREKCPRLVFVHPPHTRFF